jgi:hypothetical protein
MDHFATASTGPTRQQLTESRSAVAAARKTINEGSDDSGAYDKWDPKHPDFVKNYRKFQARNPGATLKDFVADLKKGVTEATGDANRLEHRGAEYNVYFNTGKGRYTARGTGQMKGQIAPQWFRTLADAQEHAEMEIGGYDDKGVAEAGRPDVMRHQGDTTVKVVKRGGKPIGEIGIDAEASEGNGAYYVKLYDGSYDAVGFDTAEEALAELKYAIKSMSEGELDEGMIDNIKNTVRAANYDRLARRSNSQAVAGGGLAPPAQFRALSAKGDQRAQKAQDIRKGDVAESVDPIEQLRADIRRFAQ